MNIYKSNCNHMMVDIETLGKAPDGVISEIGYVIFKMAGEGYIEAGHIVVDVCNQPGRSFDGDTVLWWMEQCPEALAQFVARQRAGGLCKTASFNSRMVTYTAPMMLAPALGNLSEAYCRWDVKRVWAHGTNFDITILEHAYKQLFRPVPWKYSAPRDTRTLFDALQVGDLRDLAPIAPEKAHNAVNDAIRQMEAVQNGIRITATRAVKGD